MSKGGGDQDVTQTNEPWSGAVPSINLGLQGARELYRYGGPDYYPNATYVPFSSQTEQALGMQEQRALQGSPVERSMQSWVQQGMQNPGGQNIGNYLNRVMGGQYLNSNPYLDQTFNAASRAVTDSWKDTVLPGINASFAGAGGSGSGIQQELAMDSADVLGRNLNELATSIYGGNYAQERQNQMQAAGMGTNLLGTQGDISARAAALAPTAASFDWNNIAQLGNVGQRVEGMAGNVLQDSMDRFNYYQNRPYDNLARYMSTISGTGGMGSTSTTQGPGSSPLTGAIGGALTGGALGAYAMPALGSALGNLGISSVLPGALPLGILGGLLGAFG